LALYLRLGLFNLNHPQGASVAKKYALRDTWNIGYEKDISLSSQPRLDTA
jgi:hypothetical protein